MYWNAEVKKQLDASDAAQTVRRVIKKVPTREQLALLAKVKATARFETLGSFVEINDLPASWIEALIKSPQAPLKP